jgi:CubicO group peptidase (beta-lactamase class C family)/pimeloyl-ACP methyl ester carboxylesterase
MNTHRLYRIAVPLLAVLLAVSSCAAPTATPVAPTSAPAVAAAAAPKSAADGSAATPEATVTAAEDDASASPSPGALSGDVVAKLDEFLQAQVYSEGADPKAHAPGLVLLVDTPDGRYLQAVGVASMEDGTPMQVDDRLEIGSNTKSFIIVLLLQLQEEGVLSIDDPLSKWLPDWAEKIPNGDQMTLRQLAQHTSGIWDYGDPIVDEAANDPTKLEQGYTPAELVQYALDNGTPDFAPGEEGMWKYSNTGYILLGMVIEKAAGQPLGELLKARIFEPLGLQTAALLEGVPEPGEITNGYWWTEDGKINNTTSWNASQGWAAGAIAMTAEELLTYGKALAAGRLFQSPDTLAEMLIFDPNGMDGLMPYGLGLMDYSKVGAPGSWGHAGETAGFQSLWYTNPETGVTVVGLTNSAAYQAFTFLQIAGLLNSNAPDTTEAPAAEVAAVDSSVIPQATPTAGQGDTAPAGDESDLEDQLAMLASTNPPPRLSERDLGVTIVPCDVAKLPDASEVEGETYYCGILTVPQNWEEPDGRNLDLTFMVAKATGESPESDPLVYLAGGPGQSSMLTAIDNYQGVRATRDIVRIDQRGTGLSQRLDVPECLALALGSDSERDQVVTLLEAVNQPAQEDTGDTRPPSGISVNDQVNEICWDVFNDAGLDLNQFTTQAAARDVVELVKALGYGSFNLHGVSYGTRLAMTILNTTAGMEDAPLVRSAVLDSSFPPSVYLLPSLARNNHDQILQLFDDCQQDVVCRDAYPNLKQRLHDLLTQLDAQPLVVDGQTVTSGDVVRQLANLSSTRPGFMPRMIAELESGRLTTFNGLVNKELGSADPESASGPDLNDPLQVFLNDVIPVLSQGGGMEQFFGFVSGFSEVMIQDDPVAALDAFINENYTGDSQAKLLDLASSLTAEDFSTSPLVAQARQEAAGSDQEAASQEETDATQLQQQRLVAVIGVAHFLNLTVNCHEDTQLERVEDALSSYNDLEFPQFASLNFLREQAGICAAWPVDVAAIEVKNPVSSTVPTLILQGAYDTKTPAYMGRRAARELANSTLVIVPQQGHEVWTSATSCAGQIATSFVLNPDAEPDLSCLEARRPQWALPDDAGDAESATSSRTLVADVSDSL